MSHYRALVIGVSLGGLDALGQLFQTLSSKFALHVCVVQHLLAGQHSHLDKLLSSKGDLNVEMADDKTELQVGTIYMAPPGYHLLVELDETMSLSVDEPVKCARPAIDVLFNSAADVWGEHLIGVILTGANSDGAAGLMRIHELGGLTIVEDPATAQCPDMPNAAIQATKVDHILPLADIAELLNELGCD